MNLLVAVDFSTVSEKTYKKAAELAKAFSAKLWLLHIAEPGPGATALKAGPVSVREDQAEQYHREHRELREIADTIRADGIDTSALLVQGPTVEMILKEADRLEADMIILGSHGMGAMYRLLVGSVSEGVLRKATCPVLIVPTHNRT